LDELDGNIDVDIDIDFQEIENKPYDLAIEADGSDDADIESD